MSFHPWTVLGSTEQVVHYGVESVDHEERGQKVLSVEKNISTYAKST